MFHSTLDTAKYLIKRRKFDMAIRFLESCEETYDGDFDYYVTAGIAYLYADVPGKATSSFRKAREIRINNSNLLLGQAAIFLRHGETDKAIEYYLNVLEIDPNNITAKEAMAFIKNHGDFSTICRWVDSGDIKRFYPPLGVNPNAVRNVILLGVFLGILFSVSFTVYSNRMRVKKNLTALERKFELSEDEIKNPILLNTQDVEFEFNMKAKDVTESFDDLKHYFAEGRDNLCQVEINRILNSNTTPSIKQKVLEIQSLLKEATFNSLKDNFPYLQVVQNPALYIDCYVIWDGSITNEGQNLDGSWKCDLLVNYIPEEKRNQLDGTVSVFFETAPNPPLNSERSVKFLGKVTSDGAGKFYLEGKGYYQMLKKN